MRGWGIASLQVMPQRYGAGDWARGDLHRNRPLKFSGHRQVRVPPLARVGRDPAPHLARPDAQGAARPKSPRTSEGRDPTPHWVTRPKSSRVSGGATGRPRVWCDQSPLCFRGRDKSPQGVVRPKSPLVLGARPGAPGCGATKVPSVSGGATRVAGRGATKVPSVFRGATGRPRVWRDQSPLGDRTLHRRACKEGSAGVRRTTY